MTIPYEVEANVLFLLKKAMYVSFQLGCTINFQAADNDATIRIDFESFIVNNCDVKLYLSGDGSGSMVCLVIQCEKV